MTQPTAGERRLDAPVDVRQVVRVRTSTRTGSLRILAHEVAPEGVPRALVCVLPGLSLPRYLLPTAQALAVRGLHCAVLDLPGLSRGSRMVDPSPEQVGRVAAAWLEDRGLPWPGVLMGHSTGAASAIHTALALAPAAAPTTLVLAGPAFTPAQRRLRHLLAATPSAYRRDSLRELSAAPRLAGHPFRVASIVRAGLRETPERLIGGVGVPVLLTAGEADTYSPRDWLDLLGRSATSAPRVDVARLPGSHNNPFTHPDKLADLVVGHLEACDPTRLGRLHRSTGRSRTFLPLTPDHGSRRPARPSPPA